MMAELGEVFLLAVKVLSIEVNILKEMIWKSKKFLVIVRIDSLVLSGMVEPLFPNLVSFLKLKLKLLFSQIWFEIETRSHFEMESFEGYLNLSSYIFIV